MALFSFKDALVVMADDDLMFSRNMGAVFHARGMGEMITCRTADQLRRLMNPLVDVLICDVGLPGLDFCKTIQDIRQNRGGINPFAMIIGTGRPSANIDMREVIRSGIDDFVLKASPTDMLMRRLNLFAETRKPFAITKDFVGPNRRAARRKDGSDDDVVEVPNTLRARLVDGAKPDALRTMIDKAQGAIAGQKSETRLKGIVRLTRRFIQLHATSRDEDEMRDTLELLATKTEEVSTEHRGARPGTVIDIAERINRLARRVYVAPEAASEIEVRLLAKLSDAVQVSFSAAASNLEASQQIAEAVDRFLHQQA